MLRGFTLIQISILLVVASLVMVAILPTSQTGLTANNASTGKMTTILTALRGYEATHAYLPCPADASLPIGSANYGVAAANAGTGTNCSGGTPASNYTDTTNNIAIGMLPVRTLGLSNDYALDSYGRDITYAVDTNATTCFANPLTGKIAITDNGTVNNSIVTLLSHGADGHGAWIPLTGSTGTAVRLNAGSTDTDEHLVNAHGLSAGGFPANYAMINSTVTSAESTSTTFVRKPINPTFDDLLVYNSFLWNINVPPASTSGIFPTIGYTNGSYYTASTPITFTLTFSQAVTVTGTPQLDLTIPSWSGSTNIGYATYQPGSSTSTMLKFSYTAGAADYAPTGGISIASPVDLNGGSITSQATGLSVCAAFVLPNLSSILVNPFFIYVADSANNRILKFGGNGTVVGQFGCSGTGACSTGAAGSGTNVQFNGPSGVAVDASLNIWVADTYNNRIVEMDKNGTFIHQIGCTSGYCSGGTGNTAVSQPWAIAIDSSNNIWVTEMGNYRVHEFNSSYAHVLKFGSQGTTKNKFEQPKGIAIDTSGNAWVSDITNNNIQEFNSSGTWQKQLGCSGSSACPNSSTTAGQFYGPAGVTFDSTSNHYLWVTEVFNSRVQELNASTGAEVTQMPCKTPLGEDCTYDSNNGDFESPMGLAFDPSGNLWTIENNGNRMQQFSGTTWQNTYTASTYSGFNYPQSIAIGSR